MSFNTIVEDKKKYAYGFSTNVESDRLPKGLNEDIIKMVSKKRNEPRFILNFRLKAYRQWKSMKEPSWANLSYTPLDYQDIHYYSAPKKPKLNSLDEVDPEVLRTFEKLGIPINEQKELANVAVDMVFDSVSVKTLFKKRLEDAGVVLLSMSEAIQKYPKMVKKYLGSVVPIDDNFFAALNSAVFSDGSFVYIPKGVTCPMPLSAYFRINDKQSGQFERTLIIADENASVNFLEGCTAPAYNNNQLHAAIVELVALDRASISYSTVQNWYPGNFETKKGGIYNFVTKRGLCLGEESKISWTQVEVGAAVTWKYPSCILKGKGSYGRFYSISLMNGHMQADTGTRMIHLGEKTRSLIVSKGISADEASNSFRSLVKVAPNATKAENFTQCDSMLIGNKCQANAFPDMQVNNGSSHISHEASVFKMSEEHIFYLRSRGISQEEAIKTLVNTFCREVIEELPLEFAVEVKELLGLKLENSIG